MHKNNITCILIFLIRAYNVFINEEEYEALQIKDTEIKNLPNVIIQTISL